MLDRLFVAIRMLKKESCSDYICNSDGQRNCSGFTKLNPEVRRLEHLHMNILEKKQSTVFNQT